MSTKQKPKSDYFNEVIWYGGFPMRRGDVIKDLDKVAKSTGAKNPLSLRDAGLMGLDSYNKNHPMPPETQPITLSQFYELTNPTGNRPTITVTKVHDDGDLTLKQGNKVMIRTTDGKVFQEMPGKQLKMRQPKPRMQDMGGGIVRSGRRQHLRLY